MSKDRQAAGSQTGSTKTAATSDTVGKRTLMDSQPAVQHAGGSSAASGSAMELYWFGVNGTARVEGYGS